MDWTKIKEEPADALTKELAASAHDYVTAVRRFEQSAKNCVFKIGDLCGKIPNDWKCGILNCSYCSPVFMLYLEETKLND